MQFKALLYFALFINYVWCALLGVDLGTGFTKAILVAPNVAFDILLTPDSKRKEPSGLSFIPRGEFSNAMRKYGSDGLPECTKNPLHCLYSVKSLLGRTLKSKALNEYQSKFSGNKLLPTTDNDSLVFAVSIDKEHKIYLRPEEVVAMQLRDLKKRALDVWLESSPETFDKDGEISEIVISVPRYFNEAQRESLVDSATLAGLKVISLVDDGVATAIDFAQKKEPSINVEKFLVLDVGAGSTKSTVISLSTVNGTTNLETLGYGYDETLNGHFFTQVVRSLIVNKFCIAQSIAEDKIINDAKVMNRAWQVAEKTKLILSANSDARVSIESFYNDIDLKLTITREELEFTVREEVSSKIINLLDVSLQATPSEELSGIILSGGSFRVPIIQSILKDYFNGDELFLKSVNADEAVVFGTTIRGAMLKGLARKGRINIIDHDFKEHVIKYFLSPVDEGLADYAPLTVIEAGALLNSKETLNLTESTRYIHEFQFEVYNNDEKTHKYNFTMPKRFNESACDEYEYFLNYECTENTGFDISALKTKCYKNGSVRSGNLIKESKYYDFGRLASPQKFAITQRLDALDLKDEERRNRTELINTLESSVYETRYLLEDYEQDLLEKYVTELTKHIHETLEWIEEEAEAVQLKDIKQKILQMERAIDVINAHVSLLVWDSAMETLELSLISVQKLYDEATHLVEKIDTAEEKLQNEVSDMGLNYETLASKIAYSNRPNTEYLSKVEEHLKELKDILEMVESVDESGYEYLIKDGWVDTLLNSALHLDKLNTFKTAFKTTWDNRSGFVQQQLSTIRNEENKKNRKKNKKAEKAAAKEASQEQNEEAEVKEEKKVDEESTDVPQHDEL